MKPLTELDLEQEFERQNKALAQQELRWEYCLEDEKKNGGLFVFFGRDYWKYIDFFEKNPHVTAV